MDIFWGLCTSIFVSKYEYNFGPAGASIDGWGDEWSWEEMFTIGY